MKNYGGGGEGPKPFGQVVCGGGGPGPLVQVFDGGDGPTPLIQYFAGGDGPIPMIQIFGGGPTPLVQVFSGPDGPGPLVQAGLRDRHGGPGPMAYLNPPWITLWNQIKESIGKDPKVDVSPLQASANPMIVHVKVNGDQKAAAIATLLNARYQFGNVVVSVEVVNLADTVVAPVTPGSAQGLADLVTTGLESNEWFRGVKIIDLLGVRVYPIFAKDVIQFSNDDLSDVYGNYNAVAAAVFSHVMVQRAGGIPLLPSTDKS